MNPLLSFFVATLASLFLGASSSIVVADDVLPEPSANQAQVFGQTLVRLQVYLGAKNPVRGGQVTLESTDGAVLLTGKTNSQGQVVFVTQQTLPDRVVAHVRRGKARGIKPKAIDLRAFFEPKDGEVVNVNPLTTLDEVCRSGDYGTYCSQAVNTYYSLTGSTDYADLVEVTAEWFDGARFARNATSRKITTYQWAERVLLRAYAGKKGPRNRAKPTLLESVNLASEENSVSIAAAGGANGAFAAGFAGMGKSFMMGLPTGAGSALGSHYFNKLMVWAGVWEGEPDIVGEIDRLRQDMRAHFQEVNAGINDLKVGQARLMERVDRVYNAVINSDYQNAVRAFDARDQRTRMATLLESWKFLLQFASCVDAQGGGCQQSGGPLPRLAPDGLGICTNDDFQRAPTQKASELVVMCAQFRQALVAYAQDFTVNGARDRLLSGAGNVTGIIPLGQYAYARYILNGVVYPSQQPDMISVGEYWLGVWAEDKGIWALITTDTELVSKVRGSVSAVARSQAEALQARWDEVAADRSGRFFPTRMPQGCDWGRDLTRSGEWAFYDLETRAFYTRGPVHYFDRSNNTLKANNPLVFGPYRSACSEWLEEGRNTGFNWGTRLKAPWQSVPASRVPGLGPVLQEVRRKWGVGNATTYPGRLAIGTWEGAGGCYQLRFGDHLRDTQGGAVMCPFIDLAIPEPKVASGMACVSVSSDAFVTAYTNGWWRLGLVGRGLFLAVDSRNKTFSNEPWSGCAPETDALWSRDGGQFLFPGSNIASWDHNTCKFCIGQEDRGPYKDARQGGDWRKHSIGGGYVRDYLPLHGDVLPAGVSREKMTSFAQYSLIMRPELSGEGFVPRP